MSGKRGIGDPTTPYANKKRKEGDPDSDESINSGNSTNAISPNAAPLEPPMSSSSPPPGSFKGAQPPKENGYVSSLSSDDLAGLMGNMAISGSESDSDSDTPPVTTPPQRRRSNTMGGKSKKRKTKYGGKKTKRKWSKKYKKSINCKKPKGFSQKQYCKYGRKTKKRRKTKKSKK